MWTEISFAFRQELTPDPVNADPGTYAYALKKINRVWRYGDAAVVVIEKTTDSKEDQEWNRLYELYDYNLRTREKVAVRAKWPFWLWKFHQLAHFDDGPAPDIVFESLSCTECEPVTILSALRFDAGSHGWALRLWGSNAEEGLVTGDAAVGVDGSIEEYMALSGIADFRGIGHEEVAVWTHYREPDEKNPTAMVPAVTMLSLYGYRNGTPIETQVKDESEIKRIKALLCKDKRGVDACK